MAHDMIEGVIRDIPSRKITTETCRKYGYMIGSLANGEKVHIAPYRIDGEVTGQKIRPKDKDKMFTTGNVKKCELFGQHLFREGGKKLVITEGEIDALSVSQAQGNKWPVVSITKGSKGAVEDIKNNLEFVNSYDEVVLMFDNDAAGRAAVDECAPLFKPGTVKVATLPRKDASDCLVAGEAQSIISAIWEAKTWRPDGVFTLAEIFDEAIKPVEVGFPWCFETMTKWTYGRRLGECIGFGAGTGVGKTDLLTQQIEYDINVLKLPVGIIFLEQHRSETANRLAGKMAGKPFHVPDGSWNNDERVAAIRSLADTGLINIYSSFGVADWDRIATVIRAMAVQSGVKLFYLDHLTALADPSNERETLEIIMAAMASMCQELQIVIHYVSHLSTPMGTSHEEGGRVALSHFKGARAIGFWTFFAFGLERNKQAEDPKERCILTVRGLKDRLTGRSDGCTMRLRYDTRTTRLTECTPFDDEVVEQFDGASTGSEFVATTDDQEIPF
ncbi:toprim domain-containing protein [Phyllobacterium endophyticum]|uniref:toprim domain-containing protein n=1 Tax=Phyllobacterium endophyticum TaxID=1149773 RepID=UPI00165094F3|nr:toprim domain-containing protein [Phyllobacterium endophyticum]